MKTLGKIGVLTMGCMLTAVAQVTEETVEVTENANGSVTETTTTTTFDPEVRTKVIGFFDTHKVHPHGLPPGLATKVVISDIPVAWRSSAIAPGIIIEDDMRTRLIAAPPELVEVLPAPGTGISYYMAGSNVVAVDSDYRVVDSLQIPSIKFKVD